MYDGTLVKYVKTPESLNYECLKTFKKGYINCGTLVLAIINEKQFYMSQAFVKESEEQWLHEIQPTLYALIVYLTRENNGIRVYEQKTFADAKSGEQLHQMSNGLLYAKDKQGKWYVAG